jgi:hypothetical protein
MWLKMMIDGCSSADDARRFNAEMETLCLLLELCLRLCWNTI